MLKSQDSKTSGSQRLFSPESTTLGSRPTSPIQENSASRLEPEAAAQIEHELQHELQYEHQKALQQAEKLAYNALARREYASQELEEKLLRKNTPVDIVKVVLRQLRDLDLQSDERFTEGFVRSRINRGQGPVRIEMELKQRGISTDLAEQHLAAEESFWLAQAKTLLARRGVSRSPSTDDADHSELRVEDLAHQMDSDPKFESEQELDQEIEQVPAMDREARWAARQQQQKVRASHARFLASRGFRSNTIAKALAETFD